MSRLQQQQQKLLAATAPVRWALDTGLDLPGHVTAHQAAAALLLLLQQLPDSFLPPDISGVLMHCVPPTPACMSLLSDTMSVAEWATLRMVLELCGAVLAPEAAASNGVTVVGLANVLAEHFFGESPAGERGRHSSTLTLERMCASQLRREIWSVFVMPHHMLVVAPPRLDYLHQHHSPLTGIAPMPHMVTTQVSLQHWRPTASHL